MADRDQSQTSNRGFASMDEKSSGTLPARAAKPAAGTSRMIPSARPRPDAGAGKACLPKSAASRKIMSSRLRPGARVVNTATAAIPAVASKAVRGIRVALETSRKIENAHPKLAARAASTAAAAGRTGFDKESPPVAGLFFAPRKLRLSTARDGALYDPATRRATRIGTAGMHMPPLCPFWRSDLEKAVNGLATDVGS